MAERDGLDHKAVVDNLFDGAHFVDLYRAVQYWNPAVERMTGYGAARAVGTPQGMSEMAERLRRLVQESSLDTDHGRVAVTVTVGATLMRAGDTPESLLRRVDELLDAGKAGGATVVTDV